MSEINAAEDTVFVDITRAKDVKKWIEHRGGLAVWDSVNLSNPGARWLTPVNDENGKAYCRPNWQCSSTPTRVITDASQVCVAVYEEVKRFHVAVRPGGPLLKVTDGGKRKIQTELEKIGPGSIFVFDHGAADNVILFKMVKSITLAEYMEPAEAV